MDNKDFAKTIIAVTLGSILVEEVSVIMSHSSEHEKPLHIPETRYVTVSSVLTSSTSGGTSLFAGATRIL